MNQQYMKRAIELAKKGEGHVNPNPLVGCVVVAKGKVIAEGYHQAYGGFHAERNALCSCREDTEGADLYVNLEPCCHQGKTPPCVEIILEKGIRRVFVGCLDPNPLVAGKGIAELKSHGVEVITGVLEKDCRKLNEIFFHYIENRRPFTAMKYAMTLDGRIATDSGSSQWITGEAARHHVHTLRRRYAAILAGIGTVLADDPTLDCRIEEGVDPIRVICDSRLRIPLDSHIVKTACRIPTILACCEEGPDSDETGQENAGIWEEKASRQQELCKKQEKKRRLMQAGVQIWELPAKEDFDAKRELDLLALWKRMGKEGIDSVLVEGGGRIHGSLLQAGLVDRVYAYLAPKLVSGEENCAPVKGPGRIRMADAIELSEVERISLGRDCLVTGKMKR